MKKFVFVGSMSIFILLSIFAIHLNDQKVVGQGEQNQKNNHELHKKKIPYRDDADYSEQGSDPFQMEEESTPNSPATYSVPHTGR